MHMISCVTDSKAYKLVGALEETTVDGVPSLINAEKFTVKGKVAFSAYHSFTGTVKINNSSGMMKSLPMGSYENCTVDISGGALQITGGTVAFC